ncbi:hypothetical protein [Methylobacterium frigidaeris]|uniref:hypothetical protein n=1 Tax=Methylobacterium frigidaeris TaxID=2038277 RepID=UPI001EDD39B0|nr:hypothetical protein [Methylobacterium frigidaeris]
MSIQIYSWPHGARDIREPQFMNDIAERQCRNIPEQFAELRRVKDLSKKIHRHKRDLIYLSEVVENEDEIEYCAALSFRMNFNLTIFPDILENPMRININLKQRVKDLILCCDEDILELNPVLHLHLEAAST